MSWLARSLANSLMPDHRDDGDDEDGSSATVKTEERSHESEGQSGGSENRSIEDEAPSRGVKDDLSELTQTLTRQFWGVASFLAPPPSIASSAVSSPQDVSRRPDPEVSGASVQAEASEIPRIGGIRSDFAEIGGRFRTGISRLSNTAAVSEISKIASTFLPFRSEEEVEEESEGKYDVGAVGVTDEVLSFARNISMHPETWLDFPLFHDFEDCDDFDMSDAQQEHALAVEYLAPRLGALRIELCPSHMSEGCFWKIYFVLLHSRLSRHDAELLSTTQIVEARAMLQRLQNRTKAESELSTKAASYRTADNTAITREEHFTASNILYESTPTKTQAFEEAPSCNYRDFETEEHPVLTTEMTIIDKSVIEEEPLLQIKNMVISNDASEISSLKYEDDGDDWLEEGTEEIGVSGGAANPLMNEDVSFSDLEEDE